MSSTAYPSAETAAAGIDAARRLMVEAETEDQTRPGRPVTPRSPAVGG